MPLAKPLGIMGVWALYSLEPARTRIRRSVDKPQVMGIAKMERL
jgi:hypothetical protein